MPDPAPQYLIVVRPFDSYQIGDVVTKARAIAEVLAAHAEDVVRVLAAERVDG